MATISPAVIQLWLPLRSEKLSGTLLKAALPAGLSKFTTRVSYKVFFDILILTRGQYIEAPYPEQKHNEEPGVV